MPAPSPELISLNGRKEAKSANPQGTSVTDHGPTLQGIPTARKRSLLPEG